MNCELLTHKPTRVLLIGLDALDWDLLSEKITAGELPHLAKLMTGGASGPLRSLRPFFSPSLWATIATGKRPSQHGIMGFTLPDASGKGLRTYDSSSRCSPAIWEMLSHVKKKSNIVGWWNSAPAEKINGVMVDETFRVAQRPCQEPWEVAPNSVTPFALSEALAKLRVHPQQLSMPLLQRLIPKLYEIDPSVDWRLSALAKILAEDLTTLQTTLHLMAQEPWDFTSLYLIGLDSFSHQGTAFRKPTTLATNEIGEEHYGELIDRAYTLYDEWVGTLVAAAGEETTIMIVSDHGFYHDDRKPQFLGMEITAPCTQHAPIGSLIIAGPQVQAGISISQATLLDICPTLLALFQLPLGRDMEGNVLTEIFKTPNVIATIPSWDQLCPRVRQSQLQQPSAAATEAALRQLVALGYLPETPTNHQCIIAKAHGDYLLHQALSHLEEGRIDRALPLLEQARHQSPKRTDILAELAQVYLDLEEWKKAAANFKWLVRCRRRDARKAACALQTTTVNATQELSTLEVLELRHLSARAHLDEERMEFLLLFADWIVHRDEHDARRLCDIGKNRSHDFLMASRAGKIALAQGWHDEGFSLLCSLAAWSKEESGPLTIMADDENTNLSSHSTAAANSFVTSVLAPSSTTCTLSCSAPLVPCSSSAAATVQTDSRHGHFSSAEKLAREALQRNPLDAASWLALARSLVGQKKWKEAKAAARQAAKGFLRRPHVYELLAQIALHKEKNKLLAHRYQRLAQRSWKRLYGLIKPFNRLLKLRVEVEVRQHDNDTASHNLSPTTAKRLINSNSNSNSNSNFPTQTLAKQPIIVTGLPRSGTSLLMQMLLAGGLDVVTDDQRQPDDHNPCGYFEHEKIKNIAQHSDLLTPGKVAKVVIPLLWELPRDGSYRIIFIRRHLAEVIASQQRMATSTASYEELESVYRYYEGKTLEILEERSWDVLELSHGAVLADPTAAAGAINDFLGGKLNVEAMSSAVQPSLHRVHLYA